MKKDDNTTHATRRAASPCPEKAKEAAQMVGASQEPANDWVRPNEASMRLYQSQGNIYHEERARSN